MPQAIRLSPVSRHLLPSSYLRHALLLGFSCSPPSPNTQSALLIFSTSSLFCSYIFRHLILSLCHSKLTFSLLPSVFWSGLTEDVAACNPIITHLLVCLSFSTNLWLPDSVSLHLFFSLEKHLTQDVTIAACSLTCKMLPFIYSNASLNLSSTFGHVPCKIHAWNKMWFHSIQVKQIIVECFQFYLGFEFVNPSSVSWKWV